MDTGRLVAGRYRLGAALGSGGMATVYGAVDESLGRSVAVKIFHADLANAGDERRQAEEISLLAGLNHPALVMLFDAGRDSEGAFIVMELVEGVDLRTRLASGAIDTRRAAHVGADVASALAHIHQRGVVHRDVKPANILLPDRTGSGTPRAKLADFGIARLIDSTRLTAAGAVVGTASFLSPEQARGEQVSTPSDVYSLALVLLEALTGQRAFPGTAVESTMARLARDPEIPSALGTEWVALLSAGTAREPGARPTAEEFAARLRAIRNQAAQGRAAAVTGTEAMNTAAMNTVVMDPELVATEMMEADDAPTRQFAADDAPTQRLPAGAAPRRISRRMLLAVGSAAVLVVVCAALGIRALVPAGAEPDAEPVVYPAVEGVLGEHLAELQRSVEP